MVFARRNVEHTRQIPEKLLDVTLQPLMFVLLFAFVFGGAIAVQGGNYREYLIGGILIQSLAFGMMGRPRPSPTTSTRASSNGSGRCPRPARRTCSATSSPSWPPSRWPSRSCSAPASPSAGGPTATRGGRRGPRPARRVRLGDDLVRHVDRDARALARRRAGHRLRRGVPADVHQQRLRAHRVDARRTAVGRLVEPDQRAGGRRCASCSATR